MHICLPLKSTIDQKFVNVNKNALNWFFVSDVFEGSLHAVPSLIGFPTKNMILGRAFYN